MKTTTIKKTMLSREEELLEQALAGDTYVNDMGDKSRKMWEEAIASYRELSQTRQMTMRVETADLIKVKARAKKYSMPYQTLLKIVFKQFAEGKIEVAI